MPVIRAAAEAAGRPMPALSARVRVAFDDAGRSAEGRAYALRGSADDMAAEVAKFAEIGVEHLALFFDDQRTAAALSADIERFGASVGRGS